MFNDSTDPLVGSYAADLEENTEIQLVKQVRAHRLQYRNCLKILGQFYERKGNHTKLKWVADELAILEPSSPRAYLDAGEIAGPYLQAKRYILEADLLYKQGKQLMKKGKWKLGNVLLNRNALYLAIDKFNELIMSFPESD